jgi:CheY-like chemotaxis protein
MARRLQRPPAMTSDQGVRVPPSQEPSDGAVLIVDDDESMRLLLSEILSSAGYRVQCADGGAEAIHALRGPAPRLVILDLLMPGTSGWDVLEFIEERPRLSTIPVVVLTAYGEKQNTPHGRPVIHKPVDGDLLREMVDELLAQELAAGRDVDEVPSDLLPGRRGSRPSRPARGM